VADKAINYVRRLTLASPSLSGTQLAQFMIGYNVGVALSQSYEVKKIDSGYFEEQQATNKEKCDEPEQGTVGER
jgi:restriction endonuclease Mrr